MSILWESEKGKCAYCEEETSVRGFSSHGKYSLCCFGCFSAPQDEVLLLQEWFEEMTFLFKDETLETTN